MKKLFIPLLVILLVSLIGGVVYASDITMAKFITKIQIDNDAVTAQSNVVGCFDLSTADMITNTMLNATATDAAMLDGATDVKFMPGWSTNPWCTFVSSIAGSTSLYQSLYSGGASGGEYAWFPGAAGGTVPDDASLEFANNGSAELDGYYDPASSGYLLEKEAAYQAYGNGSGNVTWEIAHSPTNTTAAIRPNAAGTWTENTPSAGTNFACAGDNNDTTYVSTVAGAFKKDTYNIPDQTQTESISSVTIYFRIQHNGAGNTYAKPLLITHATLYEGALVSQGVGWSTKSQAYATNPNTGVAWTWDEIDDLEIGVELRDDAASGAYCADVWIIVTYHPWVGIESDVIAEGEHTFYPAYLNPFIVLGIDDTTVPVTDNLALNLPLWQEECSTSPFNSIDSNAIACTTVNGPVWTNQGYTFDGTDDYIDCGNNNATDQVGSAMTLEAWINTDTIADPEWQHIVSKGNDEQYQLRITAGGAIMYWEVTTTSGRVVTSCNVASSVVAGAWEHWVVTYDGANIRMYKNGVLAGTPNAQTGNIVSSNDTMKIGVRDGGYGEFDGDIGEVRIYNIALSAAEVLQNYNATRSKYPGHTTGATTYVYSYAGGVTDNANDIYFCTDDIMLYVDSLSMYVSGALVDTWVWQYAATFTGDTTGNILTPSFRTTGSTDIDAAVISCEGTYEATVPTIGVSGGWTMVDSVPVSPSGMFTDGGTGFPLGPQISQTAVDAGDEPESWIGLFALGLAILTFILVYGATHNTRLGRRGSLVLASLAGEGILVYFYIVGAVAGWTLLPAGALLVFLVFWRRSTAPVD